MKTQEKRGFRTLLTILVPCFMALMFSSASPSKNLLNSPPHVQLTVCHFGKTILIDRTALDIHLAHGDGIGRCGQAPPVDQD